MNKMPIKLLIKAVNRFLKKDPDFSTIFAPINNKVLAIVINDFSDKPYFFQITSNGLVEYFGDDYDVRLTGYLKDFIDLFNKKPPKNLRIEGDLATAQTIQQALKQLNPNFSFSLRSGVDKAKFAYQKTSDFFQNKKDFLIDQGIINEDKILFHKEKLKNTGKKFADLIKSNVFK